MIRATVSFKTNDGASERWLIDFASVPRVGEEVVLRSYEGEPVQRGCVIAVRHLVFGSDRDCRAGAEQVEIDCGPVSNMPHDQDEQEGHDVV